MSLNRIFGRRTSSPSTPIRRVHATPSSMVEALEQRIAPASLVGLTSKNQLITFDSANPSKILSSVKVFGLAPGEDLLSIDSRAANGLLYGLTDENTLYTINPYNGVASLVGARGLDLSGKIIEIDFNPSVDRLRVVSDADQNLRINPNTGVVVDGNAGADGIQGDTALAYAPGDENAGANPFISAVAYDRNFQGTTLTTLFGIDSKLNALVTIGGIDGTPSPNAGAVTTVGALGINPDAVAGFEIAADGTAYASFKINGKTRLYTIDLATGAATPVGKIGKGVQTIEAVTSLPRDEVIFGVTQSNRLISFHADNPGQLDSAVAIRGLVVGESVTGLDFRPATGELFALTSTTAC